jgi:hypothetical protein
VHCHQFFLEIWVQFCILDFQAKNPGLRMIFPSSGYADVANEMRPVEAGSAELNHMLVVALQRRSSF